MKRRNVDSIKPRRPLKRTKISEGIYGSSVIYIKFVLIWLLVLSADYLLDFRFEYLWPFWLLLRSVYDSFRYQGLAFSILFVCMALTADMVAIIFIPASWLFFAASTYVWVQFVWHTDKGVCAPTIVLWVVFIYVEAMVRIKEVKNVPFHLDLCRPFAAHCIGYPVVTLGFGLKSYVGYKLRQRKIQEVCIENEFYIQLLEDALPPDLQHIKNKKSSNSSQSTRLKDWDESEVEDEANAVSQSSSGSIPSTTPPSTSNNINSKGGGLLSPLLLLGRLRRDGGSSVKQSSSGVTSKILSLFSSLWWWKKWRRTSSTATPENIYTKNGGSQSPVNRGSNSVPPSTNNGTTPNRSLNLNNHQQSTKGKVNDGSPVGNVVSNGLSSNHASKSLTGNSSSSKVPNNLHAELEYMQKKSVSARSVNSFDENSLEKDKSSKSGSGSIQTNAEGRENTSCEVKSNKNKASNINSNQNNVSSKLSQQNNLRSVDTNSNTTHNSKKNKNNNKENSNSSSSRDSSIPSADDGITIIKLENELKRTRSELTCSRQSEGDLRNQVNCLMSDHKNSQQDLMQLRTDNETLQNKLHSLVSGRQSDRSAMEKRLAEERRGRQSAESQLQNMERRLKKIEQENQQKQLQNKQGIAGASECGESCLSLRTELETEIKRMKRENRVVEERIRSLERENNVLRQESSNENKLMMSALNAMRDRNSQLEGTLSEETRVKLDLFSALGEAKRDLQISLGNLDRRDKEIEELKGKITEVLAVCPTTSFSNTNALTQITNNLSGSNSNCMPSFQYTTSKLLLPQVTTAVNNSLPQHSINDQLNLESFALNFNSLHSAPPPSISPPVAQLSSPPPNSGGNHMSGLDPNARIYTPKVVNNPSEN